MDDGFQLTQSWPPPDALTLLALNNPTDTTEGWVRFTWEAAGEVTVGGEPERVLGEPVTMALTDPYAVREWVWGREPAKVHEGGPWRPRTRVPGDTPERLALDIARCTQLPYADQDPSHPCHRVVAAQGATPIPRRQVPEAWAGNIAEAPVLFLSSNPSISEAGDATSGPSAEVFPTVSWTDDAIVEFMTRRFDPTVTPPWVVNYRFLRQDGVYSPRPVNFWSHIKERAGELLGRSPEPARDFAMTEIVRCKSKFEAGVPQAAPACAGRYLDRTLALSPARVVVILGVPARETARPLLGLPAGFGQGPVDQGDDISLVTLGDQERLVVYLSHPSSGKSGKRFATRYSPTAVAALRDVVAGLASPAEALRRVATGAAG